MEILTLSKPLKVNGHDIAELKADFDAITTQDFMQASAEASAAATRAGGVMLGVEFDAGLHVALTCRAIIRAMPEIDLLDLRRITGRDILQLQRAGRNFCLGGLSED